MDNTSFSNQQKSWDLQHLDQSLLRTLSLQRCLHSTSCDVTYVYKDENEMSESLKEAQGFAHSNLLKLYLGEQFSKLFEGVSPNKLSYNTGKRAVIYVQHGIGFENLVEYCYSKTFLPSDNCGSVSNHEARALDLTSRAIDTYVDDKDLRCKMFQDLAIAKKIFSPPKLTSKQIQATDQYFTNPYSKKLNVPVTISYENDGIGLCKEEKSIEDVTNVVIHLLPRADNLVQQKSELLPILSQVNFKLNHLPISGEEKGFDSDNNIVSSHVIPVDENSISLKNPTDLVEGNIVQHDQGSKSPDICYVGECCDEKFTTKNHFGMHLFYNHCIAMGNCLLCSSIIPIDGLLEHYKTAHSLGSLPPSAGENSTSSNGDNMLNTVSCTDGSWKQLVTCLACTETMTLQMYVSHLYEQYQFLYNDFKDSTSTTRNIHKKFKCLWFQCQLCTEKGHDVQVVRVYSLVKKHVQRYHLTNSSKDEKRFCSTCSKMILKVNFKRHMRDHKQVNLSSLAHNKVVCDICSKEVTKSQMRHHRRGHFSQFPCPLCNKVFNRKDNLKTHLRLHNDGKQFECNVCGKKFNQKVELVLHRKQHKNN